MFGRATIGLGIGPHCSLQGFSNVIFSYSCAVVDKISTNSASHGASAVS